MLELEGYLELDGSRCPQLRSKCAYMDLDGPGWSLQGPSLGSLQGPVFRWFDGWVQKVTQPAEGGRGGGRNLDGFLNGSRAEERTHLHCECQHLQAVPFVHHRRSVVSHPRARQRVDRADVTLRSLRRPSILPSHSRRVVGFNVDQGKQVNEHSPFSFSPLTSVCET